MDIFSLFFFFLRASSDESLPLLIQGFRFHRKPSIRLVRISRFVISSVRKSRFFIVWFLFRKNLEEFLKRNFQIYSFPIFVIGFCFCFCFFFNSFEFLALISATIVFRRRNLLISSWFDVSLSSLKLVLFCLLFFDESK